MAGASTAPESSEQHPHTPSAAPPPADERNDEAAGGDEAAPLLSSNSTSMARATSPKAIRVLTLTTLISAVLTLIFLLVTQIVISKARYGYGTPWEVRQAMSAVVIPALFSIFVSAVNLARLRRNLPLPPVVINLILDIVIAAFAIPYSVSGLSGVAGPSYRWNEVASRIISGIAMGTALIFGITHLVLFALRCRIAYYMDSPFSFPNGQLTFEVSIKFFKEPQTLRQSGGEAV